MTTPDVTPGDDTKSKILMRRLLWRLMRLFGGRARQWAWDDQYRRGFWRADQLDRSTRTLEIIQRRCDGGKLIEFGCGEGSLPCQLPSGTFSSYVGLDLSGIAIERAITRTARFGLTSCTFMAMDMNDWPGDTGVSTILMEECLYYLSTPDQETVLRRCLSSLSPGGSILVVVHDAKRHEKTLDNCRRVCLVAEELVEGRVYLTLENRDRS